jgi:SAM-dependent methyltransferase
VSGPTASRPVYEWKAFRYSSHDWILKLLDHETGPVRILDVGTASGYLGRSLSARGHHVTGIEKDPAMAEAARPYYDSFYLADIETFDFSLRREFDYILFADVLEHVRDPAAVLRIYLPALKETGKIIVSVPNVANIAVRSSLLFGKFDYIDRGILDRTHLRFFTLRSLKLMMSEVSCDIRSVIPTPLPIQIVFPFTDNKSLRPLHQGLHLLTRLCKTLLAYQFLVLAVPSRRKVLLDPQSGILAETTFSHK